jgi:hypothetical protein
MIFLLFLVQRDLKNSRRMASGLLQIDKPHPLDYVFIDGVCKPKKWGMARG